MEPWPAALAALVGLAAGSLLQRIRLGRETARTAAALRQARETAQSATEALDRIGRREQAVRDAVSEAILLVDGTDTIVAANAAARQLFKLADGPAISLMAAARSADLLALAREPLAGDHKLELGGRILTVRAALTGAGEVVLALRDDSRLERLERARRDLVANVGHDLRTPLTSLVLMVEQLGASVDRTSPAGRTVKAVAQQVETLRGLAEGLADLGRLESGRAPFKLQAEALADLVGRAVSSLRPQARARQVRFDIAVHKEFLVLADAPELVRAITNVLDNAVRFSPAGSSVAVRAAASGDSIELAIADAGPGIAPAELQRVFERFYRGDRARASPGSGLGLAIASHITEGHGGQIRAESPPGSGARFVFTLPAAEGRLAGD